MIVKRQLFEKGCCCSCLRLERVGVMFSRIGICKLAGLRSMSNAASHRKGWAPLYDPTCIHLTVDILVQESSFEQGNSRRPIRKNVESIMYQDWWSLSPPTHTFTLTGAVRRHDIKLATINEVTILRI